MRRILLFCVLALVSSCQTESQHVTPQATVLTGSRMTMPFRLVIGEELSDERTSQVQDILEATFDETDRLYNKWNPDSELSQLNALAAGEAHELSPQLERLLLYSEEMVELSHGLFDPTIEPLQRAWKAALEEGSTPDAETIASLTEAVGWHHIHLEDGVFTKDHDATALDLGGIAKGLCVDQVVERINDAGFPNVYFEWGGEIRASGQHPEGRPWRVFVSRFGDTDPKKALAYVELRDQAIATSGDYMQSWETTAGTFFHILNPRTGALLQQTKSSIGTVSVKTNSCMVADALATVGMLFDTEELAQEWADRMQGLIPSTEFWIATH